MKHTVVFREITQRHFVKAFAKKYKDAWDRTYKGLFLEFTYVDLLFEKSIAETICVSSDTTVKICKTEFKLAGSEVSRSKSGNRCIIAIHSDTQQVHVLLVYHKNDLTGSGSETAKWKQFVKKNYPEYSYLITN